MQGVPRGPQGRAYSAVGRPLNIVKVKNASSMVEVRQVAGKPQRDGQISPSQSYGMVRPRNKPDKNTQMPRLT